MPLYYLHVRDGVDISLDPEGIELPDVDAARGEALKVKRELLTGWPEPGSGIVIQVEDASGQSPVTIPFR
jgi:hypothetical protein